jgi:hypothetical protein
MEIGSVCPKEAYSADLKVHMHLFQENHLLKSYSISHIVSLCDQSPFLKERLAATPTIQSGQRLLCCNWAYSAELTKHMSLSKLNPLWQNQDNLAPYLPMRIELVFERNNFCKSTF